MEKIKFGTDGWRAIIAKDYTVDNVARVSLATAKWLLKNNKKPTIVIGHDSRFGGELFAETACKIFCKKGIKVFLAKDFVSTPMVSLGTLRQKADLGIVITASHNPASYNGYKLKGPYGGPLLLDKIEEIEHLIPTRNQVKLETINLKDFMESGLLEYIDLETMYCNHVKENFDLDAIRNSNLRFAYDAMFGAGQNVIKRLLPETIQFHADHNPSFKGQAPEPIHKNLQELSNYIKQSGSIDCGLATDGDADRIGLYDKEGNFIDSHHIILLLIKYLVEQKHFTGKVATSFSVSSKIGKICRYYDLEQEVTKIGFKYIAGIMISEDVLLGGEESGGIAIKGHIPERDGIWMGLTIWEYMATSGKSLQELIKDVYDIVGAFAFERSDLHMLEETKNIIVDNCEKNIYQNFGEYKIQRVETTDGYKYFFNDDEWLMIRASGTEPVLRNYAESSNLQNATSILKAAEETLLKI
ncbi:MAG TPA: phosphoglucomutase/phosphomannomutase family protein [Bacteroidia bacterium]|jgi:phosphomannomutase